MTEKEDKKVEPIGEKDESKLVDWSNPPTLSELKADYTAAQSDHSAHVSKVNRWLDNLNATGAAKIVSTGKNRSTIVPQVIRKQAEWRYASLSEPFLSTDDIFNVSPVTAEDRAAAIQNQLVLNNQFNTKMNKVAFIDDYVRTAVDEGTIIVRTGWDYQEKVTMEEVPVFDYVENPQFAPVLDEIEAAMQDPVMAESIPDEYKEALRLSIEAGVPLEPVDTGETEEVERVEVIRNQPTAVVCNYANVIIDPTCGGDLSKAGFVIYQFDTSLGELRKNSVYKNLDSIKADNAESIFGDSDSQIGDEPSFKFNDEPRKKIVAHEYWGFWDIDGKGELKPFVATWVGETLIRLEENPFPDGGLPFVTVPYLPKRKSIYGEPDGALLEDNQKIVGAVTRGMIDVMARSANGQMGVRKDALDVTNKRKFVSGENYEFNGNVDPRQGMYMHTYPEIPASAQYMLASQNQEAESITGVVPFQTVNTGKLGDTAAGVRGALDAASKRELGILRRLAAGIIEIGHKFIAMNAVFLEEEEIIRITNEEFIPVRRDDLAGKFDLRLTISTAEEDNSKAEELAFMLQTGAASADPGEVRMIRAEIARLRKMPDLAKRIEEYQPQPDPLAQQKAQLEIALLQAQIANEQSKAMENQSQANLNNSRAGTEPAKAQHLQSVADKNALDFVEQESGVKQERDLQKMGEQSRAQGNTKLLDHQLRMREKAFNK
jgi:hypothetical protein